MLPFSIKWRVALALAFMFFVLSLVMLGYPHVKAKTGTAFEDVLNYTPEQFDDFAPDHPSDYAYAPSFDRTGAKFTVTIVTHETLTEVNKSYQAWCKKYGDHPCDGIQVEGWSFYNMQPPYVCEVHVLRPVRIDGRTTSTLGHEVGHCIYGNYHR